MARAAMARAAMARASLDRLRSEWLDRRVDGHWRGRLSTSALSTATAVSALSALTLSAGNDANRRRLIERGMRYLSDAANADGGFGDTDRSHSNIATTYLVTAADELSRSAGGPTLAPEMRSAAAAYIQRSGGRRGLRERYGKDRTFVVPILTNLAIAGLVPWRDVPQLPFEAAAVPPSWYRRVRMPVVSYAIPALVAIGWVRHHHRPTRVLPLRMVRNAATRRTGRVLRAMQPDSGGYLEATPLTSFVLMALASCRRTETAVAADAERFLADSIREDDGWPIDTDLATWATSLSITALASDPDDDGSWNTPPLRDWLVSCQHRQRHPFTGADPGGWGWTDLSGAVPDGDDTPAAILALQHLGDPSGPIAAGRQWLAGLQNRDGGVPTFCRGWGRLPFDRSSVDLTAHALRSGGIDAAAAVRFIERRQNDDGSWSPLWFGDQDHVDEDNPIYGTSRVLLAAEHLPGERVRRGVEFLRRSAANVRGVEMIALTLDGLLAGGVAADDPTVDDLLVRLCASIERGDHQRPEPIGFYFAKLWYHEEAYPYVFAMAALGRYLSQVNLAEYEDVLGEPNGGA